MISSFLLVVAALGVALPPAEACTYWCMNPVTRGYECCDEGNPWYTGEVEEPVDAEVEAVEIATPLGDVDNSGSSGCVYYCLYNGQHYCCDNGENPREYFIPQHHVPQYIGPHGVKTMPPQYIVQPGPVYDSMSEMNSFNPFKNRFRGIEADTGHKTKDKDAFIGPQGFQTLPPQYIVRPVPGYGSISDINSFNPFQNRFRGIEVDTGDETNDKDAFIGPQGVQTLPPQYIGRPVPGYGSISDINSFNPFQNRFRGIEADTGDQSTDKDVFIRPQGVGSLPPPYIGRPVPDYGSISDINSFNPFQNRFRGIEAGTGDQSTYKDAFIRPQGVGSLPPQYMYRPVPGYGNIPDTNSFAPFQHSFRGFDAETEEETNDEDAFPFSSYIDHVMSSPTLGRIALDSLMSMIPFEFPEERIETSKSLDESNLAKRQVNSLTIPTLDDVSSLFFGNEEDDSIRTEREIGHIEKEKIDIPILSTVPLINSFAIPSTLGVNYISGGVRLIPSKSSLFDKNSISNRIPSKSVFFPIENSLSPSNSEDTKFLSNGIPLIYSIPGGVPLGLADDTLEFPNTSDTHSLSTGVPLPLLSSSNSNIDTNQVLNPNVLTAHTTDVPKGLPHSQGVPLPITQFQANTAFVMQHILQSPEMANVILHHLEDSTLQKLSTKENGSQVNDTQEIQKVLPDFSTIQIIESEGNLNDAVTQTPFIQIDSAKDLTSSHLSQLPQVINTAITDMYGKLPANIVPQKLKLSDHVPIQYQQSGHEPSPFPSKQHLFDLYNSQNNVYPLPGTNQYRRPIRPYAHHQTHTTYPKPTYNPSYPKATYNPSYISFSPDFIQTGSDTSGLPPTGLIPPSKDLTFFSHLPVSISENLVAPPNELISATNDSGKFVTDDVLDLVMNINKATCLCLEDGVRKSDASCPCSIEDLVVVFPPNPQQPYLLLPLSKSESFVEQFNSDKIEKELITSPSEYSIQKVSPENQRIQISKESSNQIERRTLADILGNSDKLPKDGIANDQIEKIIERDSAKSNNNIPSRT